jgi:hypothetical protein
MHARCKTILGRYHYTWLSATRTMLLGMSWDEIHTLTLAQSMIVKPVRVHNNHRTRQSVNAGSKGQVHGM